MGADWLKFRIRPGADANEVRELAAFVSEQYPHGNWIVTPSSFSDDDATRDRWQKALKRLESLLVFPKGCLEDVDYWSCTALTATPGMNLEVALGVQERVVPQLRDVDCCRVYVISDNPVFPIEWRDEAYRIILSTELRDYYDKWRGYIQEVRAGLWRQYLHDLYLFDRVTDEHQYQEIETLVDFARDSLTRTNAWCRKEGLSPIRDRILQFNAVERLKSIREVIPRARFDDAVRAGTVTAEQQQKEARYWELRQTAAVQIKEWNRFVPQKWKVQFPVKIAFGDFLARADCNWLKSFFAWCEQLLDEEYGLFLWA
jgi:hypothetical protein